MCTNSHNIFHYNYSNFCYGFGFYQYDDFTIVFLWTHRINPWTTGASVTPDWINICNSVVRILLATLYQSVYGVLHVFNRFITFVTPCATCVRYANEEPRGIEVVFVYYSFVRIIPWHNCMIAQFLGSVTALQIVSCTPLLLCNGIVLVYFAVRGTYILILRILKKVHIKLYHNSVIGINIPF